jgi:hypothetical protein
MQRKLTWSLFAAALGLFLLIYFVERKIPGTAERHAPKSVLPFATVNDIDELEVTLATNGSVRAERTNGAWVLTQPNYPARQAALETFATNLVQLRAFDRISAHDVNLQGAKSFGLEPPRALVEVRGGSNTFRFEIGGIAPLTSNVYLRLPRSGEVILANAHFLESVPRSTNDWRSPALFQVSALNFDRIQVRAGQRSFELARNASNNVWQISRPVPARADQDRVLELLQVLRTAEATAFVTDSPVADLDRFGLQAPEVELTFSAGTNRVYSIEFGNAFTNGTKQVFARLLGQTNVVSAPRALVDYLKQPYKTFHDPRLVAINPAGLDRIIIRGREEFILQRDPRGGWAVVDRAKTPVDRELFNKFALAVSSLQIIDIVKEVPTDADLKALGFAPPMASYALFEKLTNAAGMATNILFTDINFGAAQLDKVYVRRSDEAPIYQTALSGFLELPKRAFELRDRTIWRFQSNTVTAISISNGSRTNTLTRSPTGWSKDLIANAQLEEIVFRLSNLRAQEWVEKGANRLATFGVKENSPILTLQVRTATGLEQHSLRFGRQTLRRDAYAAVVFPGETEPTIFEFPGDLFQMMLQALPFPPSP